LLRVTDGDLRPVSIELDHPGGADLLVLEMLCRIADPAGDDGWTGLPLDLLPELLALSAGSGPKR
jgi:hypothetical protein